MYVTDALILKKEGVGEADVLVTALTPDFVRVRLVAQGARKVSAKLKGHLEPLSLACLSFVVGRNNYRLVGAELQNFFPAIKRDEECFRVASEIAKILDSALFEDVAESSGNFFALAREALVNLNEPPRTSEECGKVFLWFRMQFLKESGLLAEDMNVPASCADFVASEKRQDSGALVKTISDIMKANGYA